MMDEEKATHSILDRCAPCKECEYDGSPRVRKDVKYNGVAHVNIFRLVCPVCGTSGGWESSVKSAVQKWGVKDA